MEHFEAWAARCYHIKRYAVEDTSGAADYIALRLNPVQRAIDAAEAKMLRAGGRARIYVLKARRPGVTTHQQAKALHLIWSRKGAGAVTLAHTKEDTDTIFEITRRAIDLFPPELLPEMGDAQTREVHFLRRDSRFWTDTAGRARPATGVDLLRFHGSEFAHWDNPTGVLSASGPSLELPGSVIVLETTGGAFDSDAHTLWREAVKGANGYVPLFYPWWECRPDYYLPLEARDELGTLAPDEQDLVTRRGLSLEQIKWRRQKIAQYGRGYFLREYVEDPETCWLTTGDLTFDFDTLETLLRRAPEPLRTDLNGALEVYAEWDGVEQVILGVDTAEGVGGDRSAFVARTFPAGRQLAAYASSRITPEAFADLLNATGRQYGTAFQVVEKNFHGITVLRRLRDTWDYPEERLYHQMTMDQGAQRPMLKMGWVTTASSKALMRMAGVELLEEAKHGRAGVPCAAALRDFISVKNDSSGRPDFGGRDLAVAEMLVQIGRGSLPAQLDGEPVSLTQASPWDLGTEEGRWRSDA